MVTSIKIIQRILFFFNLLLNFNFLFAQNNQNIQVDTIRWYDKVRQRIIPIAFYNQNGINNISNQKLIIFSHGYGQNMGGDYLAYSYLNLNLAANGYFVVSIQHELSTDSLLPKIGIPQIVRRPFWDRGTDNIYIVINELKKKYPQLDYKHITLIGHSNGGDMTALFPQKYPNFADKIITLDNRRMPLPKMKLLKTFSLRSSDQLPDEGVIPNDKDLIDYKIKLIKLPNTIHNAMDDSGTIEQKNEINQYILSFLNE
jgi:predicted peptidase